MEFIKLKRYILYKNNKQKLLNIDKNKNNKQKILTDVISSASIYPSTKTNRKYRNTSKQHLILMGQNNRQELYEEKSYEK